MQWILILTIVGAWHDGPAEMRTVGGFTSQKQCMAAAAGWTKQMAATKQYNSKNFRALCVEGGPRG